MIKAIAKDTRTGQDLLLLGLSFANLDKLRAKPGETMIKINGKEMGLAFDVVILSGETEAHMHEMLASAMGPDTIIHIDEKLKS